MIQYEKCEYDIRVARPRHQQTNILLDQRHASSSSPITNALMDVPSTTSVVNPLAQEPQCVCDRFKVWVDVMLVFDSSIYAAKTRREFVELNSEVKTYMGMLNIASSSAVTPHHTRIGIVSYGREADLDTYLGEWNMDGYLAQEVTYTKDYSTNISDALRLSMDQFNTNNHRENARSVIVLVANTFKDGEVSPLEQATEFKNKGGIIVVYYYNTTGTTDNVHILRQIASTGYFIYNSNEPNSQEIYPQLVTAMCAANCFCPTGYVTPMADPDRGYPIAGCHTPSVLKANEAIARNTCHSKNEGLVSTAKYQEKSQYLESLIGKDVKFWLGLKYDKLSNKYHWADNTALSDTAWHPFASNLSSSSNSCVFEENMTWKTVDCKISNSYLCETKPCSSKTYCH